MIVGIGLDIIELERVQQAVGKSSRFVEKVLTVKEKEVYDTLGEWRKIEFLAGRFAAKEALSKALGTGIGSGVSFQEIEILPDSKQKPVMTCARFEGRIFVSITHTNTVAAAQVILEENSYEAGNT